MPVECGVGGVECPEAGCPGGPMRFGGVSGDGKGGEIVTRGLADGGLRHCRAYEFDQGKEGSVVADVCRPGLDRSCERCKQARGFR